MDINSIQGLNAYTANSLTTETASTRNTNKEAAGAEPDREKTQPHQEAFQVEITEQAMTLQTQNKQALAKEEQDQLLRLPNPQSLPFDQAADRQGSGFYTVA